MHRKRKILFLIPSLIGGGAERTLINVLKKIDYTKYDIDLVSVVKKGIYLDQVPNEVNLISLFNNEIMVKILMILRKKIRLNYFLRKRMLNKIDKTYDVGISFLDSAYTEFLFYHKNIHRRYSWVHSSYQSYENFAKYYSNVRYREFVKKNRYSNLDGILFVSKDSMDEFIEVFGHYNNMKVIYNIINADSVISKANENIDFTNNTFSFVSVGSLLPVKGYDRLIRAASILAKKKYVFTILILGDGLLKEHLKEFVCELGLEAYINFLGFVNNPYPYMKMADAFVMSSVSEALPTVLCEAMILGKPVVVTNCSGCRELVSMGEYGLMAEQNDEDIASKMRSYLDNQVLLEQFRLKSIERSKLFNDTKVLAEYYNIFNS